MTAARKLPPMMTVDDFLSWEGDGTDTRYELVDGVLRAMSPTTNAHGEIVINVAIAIGVPLRSRPEKFRVLAAPGIRPLMRADWNYRIPDIGITCEIDSKGDRYLSDPLVLIEVLSPSNAADTYENIRAYATLPSVQELIVVNSTRVEAEVLRRGTDTVWPANPTSVTVGGLLTLRSVGLTVNLNDFYIGTHLGL
jgi:Uma2 family endonuclease